MTAAPFLLAAVLAVSPPSAPGHEPLQVEILAGTGSPSSDHVAYPPQSPLGPARQVALGNPFGVEPFGDFLLITTVDDHCVWKQNLATGIIERVAGNGTRGLRGNAGPATDAAMDWPHEVRVDAAGDLYIADTRNHLIRRLDSATGSITRLGGTGESGFSGDGADATKARFNQPHSVVLDDDQGILIADTLNHRIRRIDLATGDVTTIAGTGEKRLPSDGHIATQAPLFGPRSLAVSTTSIWIALREGNSIWRIDRMTGKLHHVAGTGEKGLSADGTAAAEATFNGPKGLAIDPRGDLIVADTENHVIRHIDLAAKVVTTLKAVEPDGSPMKLARPHGVAVLATGDIIVGDSENHRVIALKAR